MTSDQGRVLYQGRYEPAGFEICVTTNWCIVNGTRYPMSGLSMFGSSRGRHDLRQGRRVIGLAIVTIVLVLVSIAICGGWTRQLWVALVVAVVATAAVTALPAVLGTALRRPYQIWARYRGAPVLLFTTRDPEQHGQVARALMRARDLSEEGRT
jgi:hypothetical protein